VEIEITKAELEEKFFKGKSKCPPISFLTRAAFHLVHVVNIEAEWLTR
jgi:hypothetical protein